jgi:tellurite resistance protein TehA-like permease
MKSAWILGFIPIIVLAAACSEYFKSNENHEADLSDFRWLPGCRVDTIASGIRCIPPR